MVKSSLRKYFRILRKLFWTIRRIISVMKKRVGLSLLLSISTRIKNNCDERQLLDIMQSVEFFSLNWHSNQIIRALCQPDVTFFNRALSSPVELFCCPPLTIKLLPIY